MFYLMFNLKVDKDNPLMSNSLEKENQPKPQ